MADYPPFMNAYGSIPKILEKIKSAATPPRFTQDFLSTKLGFKGGSYKAFLPLAKRIGLLSSDGVPTETYKKFRNQTESKTAMAEAIEKGYPELFERNEYANKLEKNELLGLVMEITGLEKDNNTLKAICSTFDSLKKFADFDEVIQPHSTNRNEDDEIDTGNGSDTIDEAGPLKFNLAYTINLVLPKTDDVAVFNAIFKSLKTNLL